VFALGKAEESSPNQESSPENHLAWRLGGDSSKEKAAPLRAAFQFSISYQHFSLVAGIGFEPMTFRL
jgi:hypothetical protein